MTPEQLEDLMTKCGAVYDAKLEKDQATGASNLAKATRDAARTQWSNAVNNGETEQVLTPLAEALVDAEVSVLETDAVLATKAAPHTAAVDALNMAIDAIVQGEVNP